MYKKLNAFNNLAFYFNKKFHYNIILNNKKIQNTLIFYYTKLYNAIVFINIKIFLFGFN